MTDESTHAADTADAADGADTADTADELEDVLAGHVTPSTMAKLTEQLAKSARTAGAGAVASGRWLSEWIVDNAPRIPIRSREMLIADTGGLTGKALTDELIRRATRASAAVGAVTGGLVTAEEFLPPVWLTLPLEILVDTLAVAAVEMKLIGELHAALDRPIPGSPGQRGLAILQAWAERRGVTPAVIAGGAGLAEVLGHTTRAEIVRLVRIRVMRRMGRNMAVIGPFLAGAAAGAYLNRRGTKSLGEAVLRDNAVR